jgi:CHAT domain-containing protein
MKLFFTFIILFFLSFSAYSQQTTNLDSLEATLENLSWKELDSIGREFEDKYEFDKSELYLKKALQVAEKQSGKDSLYAISCRNLGITYARQSLYQKTELLFIEAREIQERVLGKEHLDYIQSSNSLGVLYKNQGSYEKAEPFAVEARELTKKLLGDESLMYATYSNNLASLYYNQGLYLQAEPLYLEAKRIYEKLIGKENNDYTRTCNNLAILYFKQGLYQKAESLYLETKDICEQISGKENFNYAASCNNLANLYFQEDLYQKAEPLYLETKAIIEKIVGKNHSYYANFCINLAAFHEAQGLYKKAEPLYLETKEILEKTLGKNHPDYADVCGNLAILYSNIYLYLKAESLFLEAKEIREKALGKQHPDYAISCKDLANFYMGQGLYKQAQPFYEEALQNKKEEIKLLFPTLSESEKQEYFSSVELFFTSFTDFATLYYPKNKKISQDLFNQHLFTKSIIFSSTQKMKMQISSSNDSVLINQYEEWKSQKENYISLIQTPTNERDSTFDLTKIAFDINELEREVSKKSEAFRENTNQKEYKWQDVKQTLSQNEAVIEIIRLETLNIQQRKSDTLYIALIVTDQTKESPELLVLENGKEMEKGDFNFYQNTTQFQLENNESYSKYWKPIQDKLDSLSTKNKTKGYSKIYFSPDGVYHKLNLNILKNPTTNKYLVEEQNIQFVASSRELIERKEKGTEKVDLSKNFEDYKVCLLGYPAYNLNGDTLKVNGTERNLNGLQRLIGQQSVVPVLEGTKVETNEINDLFHQKSISTTLLQNKEATEENIKAIQNPTILHFATHGFFIDEISESKTNTVQEAEDNKLLKNPFFRSGLLLAGCQNPQTGQEDGILSAQEAMNLNLTNTELVVLSACETGLGDIQNGEGVYGLQRAFRQAGAKTLIMSLWKVSDDATQLLMTTFYEELLSGKSKREAFKIAQLKLKETYSEPFYWGAFVMVGE